MLKRFSGSGLLRGAGTYLFSNILFAIIPFLLLPVLTRVMGPAEYGQVAVFHALLGALSAFVGAAFVGAVNRKYFDSGLGDEETAAFIASCLQLVLFSSVVVFLFLYIFQDCFSKWLGLAQKYVLLAVIVSVCSVVIQLRLGQWQVRKRSLSYGVFQVSQGFAGMLLSVLFVVIFLRGAEGYFNAQLVAGVLFSLVALLYLKRDRLLLFFSWKIGNHKELLAFGVPLMPHIAGGFLLSAVDRIVISKEIGLAEAGIYMVAVQLTAAMALVFDAINKAYVPWLFERLKRDNAEEKRYIVKLTYTWYLLIVLGVLLAFLIGPWLVVFLAGEEFSQAGEVIGWLALGQGFQGMYLMVTNYVFFSKKTGVLSLVSIGSGLFNVILLVLMVQVLGLLGAAIAYSISMGIRFLLTWYVAHKKHAMPWFDFL